MVQKELVPLDGGTWDFSALIAICDAQTVIESMRRFPISMECALCKMRI